MSVCAPECHYIMTTLWFSRLQNSDESLVVSSCEFICEVLLQDFPPELFLQRPLIVKVIKFLVIKTKLLMINNYSF